MEGPRAWWAISAPSSLSSYWPSNGGCAGHALVQGGGLSGHLILGPSGLLGNHSQVWSSHPSLWEQRQGRMTVREK